MKVGPQCQVYIGQHLRKAMYFKSQQVHLESVKWNTNLCSLSPGQADLGCHHRYTHLTRGIQKSRGEMIFSLVNWLTHEHVLCFYS